MNAVLGGTLVVGLVYIGDEPAGRPALPHAGPARAMSVTTCVAGLAPDRHARVGLAGGLRAAFRGWLRLPRNPLALVGLAIVLLLSAPPSRPARRRRSRRRRTGEPSAAPSRSHWFGTDELGRDIFAARLRRARHPEIVVLAVLLTARPSAWLVGCVAGLFGGWATRVLMRITDIFLAFPRLILALAFVAALGPGHQQRRHRHRADGLAALCPARAGRDARHAQCRLHRRRAHCRRRPFADHPAPCRRCASRGDRARDAGHGRHHPDGRRPGLPGPGRAAADAGMGRHDRRRRAQFILDQWWVPRCRALRSSSSAWPSTCWATGCATCWIRSSADMLRGNRKPARRLPTPPALWMRCAACRSRRGARSSASSAKSGSGKSLTARAILRLLPGNARGPPSG